VVRVNRGVACKNLPEPPTARVGEPGREQRAAPPPRRLCPARKAARDHGLDLGPYRHAEHRRGAIGRDADDERRPVNDRPEGEVAESRLVDDVHRHALLGFVGDELTEVSR